MLLLAIGFIATSNRRHKYQQKFTYQIFDGVVASVDVALLLNLLPSGLHHTSSKTILPFR